VRRVTKRVKGRVMKRIEPEKGTSNLGNKISEPTLAIT